MKNKVISYVNESYTTAPEYPFDNDFDTAVFRNGRNKKWFGIIICNISAKKLGLDSEKRVDVINLKCEPMYISSVADGKRIFRAYHMNKQHWISVLLDKNTDMQQLEDLIDMSYLLVEESK